MTKEPITLFAVGDLQLMTREPPADLFDAVTPLLSAADVTFGNFEGTLHTLQGGAKLCRN